MIKKVVWGTLFVALAGVLVAGGVIRTLDRTGHTAEARGSDEGRGYGAQGGAGKGLNAQGYGEGTALSGGEAAEWLTLEGTVTDVDEAALTVRTDAGAEILIEGQPWRFAQSLGFAAQRGDRLTLRGFEEGGEFKAAQIANQRTGQGAVLRDEAGRPMWSGRGRRGG